MKIQINREPAPHSFSITFRVGQKPECRPILRPGDRVYLNGVLVYTQRERGLRLDTVKHYPDPATKSLLFSVRSYVVDL